MAIPKANMTRRRYGAGKLWAFTLGTPVLTSSYAPVGTAGAFTQGTDAATKVPGSTSLLPLGITNEGMEFTTSIDTEEDESAEYFFPHKVMVTAMSCTMSMSLKTVNLTNLRLALNAGTANVSATPDATTVAKLTPPLPGQEKYCQLLWESLDDNMLIVVYQALQTSEVTISGKKGAEGTNLELEFTGILPDASVATTPYDIFVIGTSWAETVSTD